MKETVAADFKDFLANTSDICVIIKREENKYNCNTVCSFEEEPRPTVSHYLSSAPPSGPSAYPPFSSKTSIQLPVAAKEDFRF